MTIHRFSVLYSPEGIGGGGATSPDFDSIVQNFDANYTEEPNEQVEPEETEDLDLDEDLENEDDEFDEFDEDEDEDLDDFEEDFEPEIDEEEPQHDPDEERRNQAFANLRRQAQENQQYADFVKQLAEVSGVSPEQVMERLEDIKMQEKAEKDGVSVEVARRLTQLEAENKEAKLKAAETRFNAQVEKVVDKYGATEADLDATYQYALENGLDLVENEKLNFETIFKAAHIDTIVQSEIHRARQKDLATKKQRQASSPGPNGTSANNADGDLMQRASDDAKSLVASW